jgi:hypothetical protein
MFLNIKFNTTAFHLTEKSMVLQTEKAHINTKGQNYVELPFQDQGIVHYTLVLPQQ